MISNVRITSTRSNETIYITQIRAKNNYLFCSSFTSSRVKIRFSREKTEDCVK